MRISDWSSDVCSSDLISQSSTLQGHSLDITCELTVLDEPIRFIGWKHRWDRGVGCRIQQPLMPLGKAASHMQAARRVNHEHCQGRGSQRLYVGTRNPPVSKYLLDRKSTRLNPDTNAHLVCRPPLEQ